MRPTYCVIAALILLGACSHEPAATSTAAQSPKPAQSSSTAPSGQTATGTVLETMDAAGYTYVHVKTDSGDIWAATAQVPIAKGDRVVVPLEMPAKDFHSPGLNRDFPVLYFASHIDREGEKADPAAGATAGGMMPAHGATGGGMGAPGVAATPVAKMTPPEGGLSIADVWAKRASLAGKTVTVRGQVVKFNGGILDRNWIHIQDGSGNAKDGTNDVTLTTQDIAKVGDVITVTGTLALDKDIGSGYKYGAIVENAKIRK